jgi:PIN domain
VASDPTTITVANGLDILDRLAGDTRAAVEALLEISALRYDDINAQGGAFFVGWNVWQWQPLPDEAQPLVGAARRAHDELFSFAEIVFRAGAPDRAETVTELSQWLLRLIEQPNGTLPNGAPGSSIEQIIEGVGPALDAFLVDVARLPTAHGADERLLVADTSALLDRPDLQNWTLDGGAWTMVLVPQVVSELDDRKRDLRTADAAQKVIRQIDEFDRRGDTFSGVPLAGKLRLREVPRSPDMAATLPWLRADTPDDLIVAAALELVTRDLRGRVAVIASDRNVRNKARLAGLTTIATSQL